MLTLLRKRKMQAEQKAIISAKSTIAQAKAKVDKAKGDKNTNLNLNVGNMALSY